MLLNITGILIGSASTISSLTMGLINPAADNIISSSTAILSSTAMLITNEYISKFKKTYTKLKNWINVKLLLDEKSLEASMVVKKMMKKKLRN